MPPPGRVQSNVWRASLKGGYAPGAGVGAVGGAADVAGAVRRWAEAGAGTVVLQPTADEPSPEEMARWAGGEVRPLVSR